MWIEPGELITSIFLIVVFTIWGVLLIQEWLKQRRSKKQEEIEYYNYIQNKAFKMLEKGIHKDNVLEWIDESFNEKKRQRIEEFINEKGKRQLNRIARRLKREAAKEEKENTE